MSRRRSRLRGGGRGAGRLRLIVVVLFLLGLIYAGKLYGEPCWTYLSMFDPVKEAAMTAAASGPNGGEEKAFQQLQARARGEGLELDEDAIQIHRREAEVVVRARWNVPIDLAFYPHTLHFAIEKRQPAL